MKPEHVHAGDAISDFIHETGSTQTEWARRIGCSEKHLSQVVNGHARLSPRYALLIEAHFDLNARYLMRTQADYDLNQARAELAQETA